MSIEQPGGTIPLELAEKWTTNWRTFIAPLSLTKEYVRAFYIPISDIIDLGTYHNVEAVRAYICLEDPTDTATSKLVLVPVSDDNKDILSVPTAALGDPSGSAIYDFTKPCPEACDVDSPLFYNP